MADGFISPGIHFMGTLDSLNCNNTLIFSTTSRHLCPNFHNNSVFCGTLIYHCLTAEWSGTCSLVFLFLKLEVMLWVWFPSSHKAPQLVDQITLTFQGQIKSLSTIVLQNQQGLDLLTAKKSGLCFFLRAECHFNQSDIVKNNIQQL